MLKAALILILIIAVIWYLAMCKAAGKDTKFRDKWIEQRKKEEQEAKESAMKEL